MADADALLPERADGAVDEKLVRAVEGVHRAPVLGAEEGGHGALGRLDGVGALDDPERGARLLGRRGEAALSALAGRPAGRVPEEGPTPVAVRGEVTADVAADVLAVAHGGGQVRELVGRGAVDEDDRDSPLEEALEVLRTDAVAEYHGCHAQLEHRLDELRLAALAVGLAVGRVRGERVIAGGADDVLDARDQLGVVHVLGLGRQDPDGAGSLAAQHLSRPVRPRVKGLP